MSAIGMLLAALLIHRATAQSTFQVSPSLGSGGSITFPLFSNGQKHDQRTSESQQIVSVVPPPDKISPSQEYKSIPDIFQPLNDLHQNISKSFFPTDDPFGKDYTGSPTGGTSYGAPSSYGSRNNTSRFFTLNTGRQTLDLGISFTVPFLSVPMTSLMNMGQSLGDSTYTALNSLMAINWPSVLIIGGAILAATFLLPQLASLFTTALGSTTSSSYSNSYGRTVDREGTGPLPVAPFTAILNQLDDALAQYDLDSTSCMQRAVCSYVAGSEESIIEGEPDSSELIISGLARSPLMQTVLGQGSIAKAVEMGRKEGHCQRQFPKCPFSVGSVFKFLASYASLLQTDN